MQNKKLNSLSVRLVWALAILYFGFVNLNNAQAQIVANDSVSMGANYANDVWYSLTKGVVKTAPAMDWDLAFQIEPREAGIRINGAKDMRLYLLSQNIEDWANIDYSTEPKAETQLLNSDTSWNYGAFNVMRDPKNAFDYGWGEYDVNKNWVVGNNIYLLALPNKRLIKIKIDSLDKGATRYKFTYAEKGAVDKSIYVDRKAFTQRNFVYFSFDGDRIFDREPDNATWDFVFMRYVTLVQGIPYAVSGVLHNHIRTFFTSVGVKAAHVYPVDLNSKDDSKALYNTKINTIGADWKEFNNTTFKWTIQDSLIYFVKSIDKALFKVVFTGFSGTSSGTFRFYKEFLRPNSRFNALKVAKQMVLYPNPNSGSFRLSSDSGMPESQFNIEPLEYTVYDIYGKTIESGQTNGDFDLKRLPSGTYTLVFNRKNTDEQQILRFVIE